MTEESATGRRRLAPEIRRRQVLDAAVAVFSEEGFHGASMEAVAARAGVSKPLVYLHGGSKDELFAACLHQEANRLLHTVTEAARTAEQDPQDRLLAGLRAFFHAVTTRRQGWTVLYRQASTGGFAGEVADVRRRIVERAADLLAGGLGPSAGIDVAPLAHTLVGAAEGLADWWLSTDRDAGEEDPAETLARMLMTVVWPGLDALRTAAVAASPPVSDAP